MRNYRKEVERLADRKDEGMREEKAEWEAYEARERARIERVRAEAKANWDARLARG